MQEFLRQEYELLHKCFKILVWFCAIPLFIAYGILDYILYPHIGIKGPLIRMLIIPIGLFELFFIKKVSKYSNSQNFPSLLLTVYLSLSMSYLGYMANAPVHYNNSMILVAITCITILNLNKWMLALAVTIQIFAVISFGFLNNMESSEFIENFSFFLSTVFVCTLLNRNSYKNRFATYLAKESALFQAQANKFFADSVQAVIHDIRSPLASTLATSELLKACKTLEDFQRVRDQFSELLIHKSEIINGILQEIMDFGIDKKSNPEKLDLPELIRSTLSILAGSNRIKCNKEIGADIIGDKIQFQRLFLNLFKNALESTDKPLEMWVRCKQIGTKKILIIGNNGPKIPEDDLQKMFLPKYSKGKSSGSGLGLAIARKIVEEHNGFIECINCIDQGIEFRIYFNEI